MFKALEFKRKYTILLILIIILLLLEENVTNSFLFTTIEKYLTIQMWDMSFTKPITDKYVNKYR